MDDLVVPSDDGDRSANPLDGLRSVLDPRGRWPGHEFTARLFARAAAVAVTMAVLVRWDLAAMPVLGGIILHLYGPIVASVIYLMLAHGLGWWAHAAVMVGTDLARGINPVNRWRAGTGEPSQGRPDAA
ncbi:hypothetical protein ACFV1W_30345 [Kitasatospora sp. NPDC059648]|uniref:hypothetical protein n=1 Tax=Kitasatospora sp. NPDC059648 TaxID=3346894 RepID=UPI00368143F1